MATPQLPPPIVTHPTPNPTAPSTLYSMDELKHAPDPPLVFSFSMYLEDQTKQIWNTSVAWEAYQRAMLISETDMNLIKKLDAQLRKHESNAINENAKTYIETLYRLLQTLNKNDTLQYLLALTNLLLQDYPSVASQFHSIPHTEELSPISLFAKFLSKEDVFIPHVAAKIITFLLCSSPFPPPTDLSFLYSFFDSQFSNTNPQLVDLAIQNIQSLLSMDDLRISFYTYSNGKLVSRLLEVLNKNTNPQLFYQVIDCFWLLTFKVEIAKSIQHSFNLIPALVEIGKGAIKEKIIRVILATFRNLIHYAPVENTHLMIGSKVVPLLMLWKQQRTFEDIELHDDMDRLISHLKEAMQQLSTFDEYKSELKSGKLDWSPVHTSEVFWKQNASKLNDHDYELVRMLARHLSVSTDPLILAVAAHDLGFYIQYYPAGRKILQEIGAKHRLMELMSNEDASVRYQALMAVQKFMKNSWDM